MDRRFHQRTVIAAIWLRLTCAGFAIGQEIPTVSVQGTVVDEAGMLVNNSRVVINVPIPGQPKVEADAPAGEFNVKVPRTGNQLMLLAHDRTGEWQGMHFFSPRQTEEPIRITLHKGREIVVTVTDPSNRSIPGARVGVDAGLLRGGTFGEQITDDVGR